jgi:hypothetical protein
MQQDTHVFYIERTIEVETKITIKKEDDLYFAYVYDELGHITRKLNCWLEDKNLYTEECYTDQEYDCVIDCFRSFIEANGTKYARKCTCCGKGMNEGFFADYEYFCDNDCLYTEFPPTIWGKVAEEDSDNYYWTEWEDEEDYQYVLFNNQLIEL